MGEISLCACYCINSFFKLLCAFLQCALFAIGNITEDAQRKVNVYKFKLRSFEHETFQRDAFPGFSQKKWKINKRGVLVRFWEWGLGKRGSRVFGTKEYYFLTEFKATCFCLIFSFAKNQNCTKQNFDNISLLLNMTFR